MYIGACCELNWECIYADGRTIPMPAYLHSFVFEDLLVKSAGFLGHSDLGLFELGLVLVQMKLQVGRCLGTLHRLPLVQLQGLLGQAAHTTQRMFNSTQRTFESQTHTVYVHLLDLALLALISSAWSIVGVISR